MLALNAVQDGSTNLGRSGENVLMAYVIELLLWLEVVLGHVLVQRAPVVWALWRHLMLTAFLLDVLLMDYFLLRLDRLRILLMIQASKHLRLNIAILLIFAWLIIIRHLPCA